MRRYLRFARMDSFGVFGNRTIGPFSPGLTVVHGRNEAGKSTLAAFIEGVLFGWEAAHGSRNTYKPAHAERAGALIFACSEVAEHDARGAGAAALADHVPDGGFSDDVSPDERAVPSDVSRATSELIQVFRARNADGLQGDIEVASDIDKETFKTLFSLSADELRGLRDPDGVTAHLLTAGSGTAVSPAAALGDLERRIASYTSSAASATHSLKSLGARLDSLRAQVSAAADETERFKAERRELRAINGEREAAALRVAHLNRRVDALNASCTRLADLDVRLAAASARAEEAAALLQAQEGSPARFPAEAPAESPEALGALSEADERVLRLQLEDLAYDQDRARHRLALARESQLVDGGRDSVAALPSGSSPRTRDNVKGAPAPARVLALVAAVCALLAATGLFGVLGWGGPLSPMRDVAIAGLFFGLAGMLFSLGAALFIRRTRRADAAAGSAERGAAARERSATGGPSSDDGDSLTSRVQDCAAELQVLDEAVAARLAAAGLSAAGSSARAALALLDEGCAVRAARQEALRDRQRRAEEARALAAEAESLARERAVVLQLADVSARDAEGLAVALDRTVAERDALVREAATLERRAGELSQRLSQAQLMHSFDDLKLAYQQARTRFNESQRGLALLLLARRLLSRSIGAWEGHSQPQVYREAGRLLSFMTDGRWQRVERTADGGIEAVDAALVRRSPQQLSLGTRQQLYLALRIALLLCADGVGRSVPVLADDILVHFDDERRQGAARALAELARVRQVIVLTCHREVVESMRSADSSAALVEL